MLDTLHFLRIHFLIRTFLFLVFFFFFFNDTATTEIYTLSLHDALPISAASVAVECIVSRARSRSSSADVASWTSARSEEHTSELQSRENLVCRLLLEKKKKYIVSSLNEKKQKNI